MDNQKALQFNGTAGGYFVVFLVTLITTYIPFFGWAYGFNFQNKWMADNTLVNGKPVVYNATFGESLKFVSINFLFLLITLGIYMFWLVPKAYRYTVDHVAYAGEAATPAAPAESTPPVEPAAPADPAPPVTPEVSQQPPANPVQ